MENGVKSKGNRLLFELAPWGGGREKGGSSQPSSSYLIINDSKNVLNSEGNRMLFEIAEVSSSPGLS